MTSTILIFLLCIPFCLTLSLNFELHWKLFKATHNKQYVTSHLENKSRQFFEYNLLEAALHNLKFNLGIFSFKMDVNEFSDQPYSEVIKQLCGTIPPINITRREMKITNRGSIPSSFDWRNNKGVTSVKNQGGCGSCWAFGASGAIEGQLVRKGYQLQDISQQQLVDCSKENSGCGGGWPDRAFSYLKVNGIETESDYPYKGKKGTCRFDTNKVVVKVQDYTDVESDDEYAMAEALVTKGPLVAAIHVSNKFMGYRSGVYMEDNCSKRVNHAVLVVGYGSAGGEDYWIVKNSWGTGWGESGYVRIARNKGSMCRIATYPSYPTLV